MTRHAPYKRIFSGQLASVMDPLEWVLHIDAGTFASIGMNQHSYRRIEAALVERVKTLSDKHEKLKAEIAQIGDRLNLLSGASADGA
ncbi:hypothetical protein ACU4GR_27285 [Methylobacterium oryzae CBMB20]